MELLTRHATARMQQRGIRAQALEALLDFGRERHIHFRGREIVYFDKKARARLARSRAVAPAKAGPSASRAPTRSLAPTAPSSPSATAFAASRVDGVRARIFLVLAFRALTPNFL